MKLWTVLAALRSIFEPLRGILAPLGRLFGSLGGVLGRSWGLLGPLGTVLAAILRPINHKIENQSLHVNFPKLFGSILAPQMGPKTTPRRPQNESKIKTKNA